jgi:hypothetical protein
MADNSLIPNFDQYFAGNKAAAASMMGSQNAEQQSFLKDYKDTIAGQETQSQMADRLGAKYNLPTLSKNAFDAQQALYNAPEVVTSSVRGSDVNQNQLDRMKSYQIQKLSPIAQKAQDQANFVQGTVNTQMGYATKDQEKALSIFPVQQQLMMDRQAREASFFSSQQEQELNSIIAKMNAGIQISEGEKNRAAQLANSERTYNAELARIAEAANTAKNSYLTLSPGETAYNPSTGRAMYTAPYKATTTSTYKPNFGGGWG